MEDVLVIGGDKNEHWDRLRKLLERVKSAGMTLGREKCEFEC